MQPEHPEEQNPFNEPALQLEYELALKRELHNFNKLRELLDRPSLYRMIEHLISVHYADQNRLSLAAQGHKIYPVSIDPITPTQE